MRTTWKIGLAAAVMAGGLGLGAANAAPVVPSANLGGDGIASKTAYVCGPFGCRWRPGYGYYRPRPVYGYGGGYGRRCWWRPTPFGPRRVCRW